MLRRSISIAATIFFVLAVFVVLGMTAFASGQVATNPPEFVFMHDKLMVQSEAAPVFDDVVMTETQVIEGKNVWVTLPVTGTHEVNNLNVGIVEVKSGESINFGKFSIGANPESWGKVGVVEYPADPNGQIFSVSGYGFTFVKGSDQLMWWDFESGSWGNVEKLGFYSMVFVPADVPTPVPSVVPAGFNIFLSTLYKAPTPCSGNNPTEPFGVYGIDGLFFDSEVQIGNQISTKFDLVDGPYSVKPVGCIGNSFEITLDWVLLGETYDDGMVSFKPQTGPDLYLVSYPGSVYVLNGSGYDTSLDWGKYGLEFWNGIGWVTASNWADITTIRVVTK